METNIDPVAGVIVKSDQTGRTVTLPNTSARFSLLLNPAL